MLKLPKDKRKSLKIQLNWRLFSQFRGLTRPLIRLKHWIKINKMLFLLKILWKLLNKWLYLHNLHQILKIFLVKMISKRIRSHYRLTPACQNLLCKQALWVFHQAKCSFCLILRGINWKKLIPEIFQHTSSPPLSLLMILLLMDGTSSYKEGKR